MGINKQNESFNKNVSTLLLLAFFIIVTTFSMNAIADEFEVHNNTTRSSKLKVTCANKVDDFPSFSVAYGDKYLFEINNPSLNIGCTFEWTGASHKFQIYNTGRDQCVTCVWHVIPNGPCFQDDLRGGEKCYPWYT